MNDFDSLINNSLLPLPPPPFTLSIKRLIKKFLNISSSQILSLIVILSNTSIVLLSILFNDLYSKNSFLIIIKNKF